MTPAKGNRTIADNRSPLWVKLLLVAALVYGLVYALPNLYSKDPALQISPASSSISLGQSTLNKADELLSENNISVVGTELNDDKLLIRFNNTTDQLQAKRILSDALGNRFNMAFNLATTTPSWMLSINALPMYLGLDLRGGVHFLMDVDIVSVMQQDYQRFQAEVKTLLRKQKIRYRKVSANQEAVHIQLRDSTNLTKAEAALAENYPELDIAIVDESGAPSDVGNRLTMKHSLATLKQLKDNAVSQNITTLRNRTNELGVSEPVIQRQGEDRIVVELPGIQDTVRAKEILGATASLEFRLVDETQDHARAERTGIVPAGTRLHHFRDGTPLLLKNALIITGASVTNASSGIEQNNGSPMVSVTLDDQGGNKMLETTKRNINNRMAVVFIEKKVTTELINGEKVKKRSVSKDIINAASIREQFSNRFQITGLGSPQEARDLALLLRAGSLAAPMEIVEERTVGPSLGQDNIRQGFNAVIIGFILVLVFMLVRYKLFGLVANVALASNLVLVIAVLSLLQATLTLPGIAGIVLTVGMAVDANVLIFERIKEEIKLGSNIQQAIYNGYNKAFVTIADANVTTLIAAIVLFLFGTGPIKGFAITLSIGIVTSMFTAIMGTRAVINHIYGNKKIEKLSI